MQTAISSADVSQAIPVAGVSIPSAAVSAGFEKGSEEGDKTTRYTNQEWASIIAETERSIVVMEDAYPCPAIGSAAFKKTIDHTLLKLEAKASQFDDLCAEARASGFATVCVRPQFVQKCVNDLKGTDVEVDSVVGFPEGTADLDQKLQEAKYALHAGAAELDVVLNYPLLNTGDFASIYDELATLRLHAAPPTLLKLIFETSQLDRHHIIAACLLAATAKFDFVKTSTGFLGQGATAENVRLMRACCDRLIGRDGNRLRVKASGGIRTLADAVTMLEAGASRLGTSAGVWIAKEASDTADLTKSPPSLTGPDLKEDRPGLATRPFTDY